MRKRSRIVLALLLLAVIGGIAWQTLRPSEQELVYQGKPLSAWLESYDRIVPDSTDHLAADDAVRHLGTNAFPTLLRRLQTKDAPLTDKLFALAQKQHFITVRHEAAVVRRYEGINGFYALRAIGRDAVPALIELYGKVSPECRPYIAEALGGFGPDAKKAVPLLILGLGETNAFDGEVGGVAAADALGDVHSEPQLSVPALIKCLSNQNPSIRRQASTALAHFGADAKTAVPTLINLLNDSAQRVKDAARDALKAIDPEAAETAGVK